MRAVVFRAYGGPERLELVEVPKPEAGVGEAIVRVAACGVNNVDLQIRAGTRAQLKLPHMLGGEVAGWVDSTGPGVDSQILGKPVAVAPFISCGHCVRCRDNRPTICERRDTLGLGRDGGYAEYVAVPAKNLVVLPAGLRPQDAAALTLAGLTAWHMLVTRAVVKAGETVLVLAGASGVGSIAIQVARLCGARVFTTARTAAKRAATVALGANEAFDSGSMDWPEAVRRASGGRGVDIVVEHVGAATWSGSVRALAAGGRIVYCGATTGGNVELDMIRTFSDEIACLGSRGGDAGELQRLLSLAADGKVQPVIDTTFSLEQAQDAHRLLASGNHVGKILLSPLS